MYRPEPSMKRVAAVWPNWLPLPVVSPVRRMSSAPVTMVRVEPTASISMAPITTSSPGPNEVVAVPSTVRPFPTETLPVSTELALSPRKVSILASPLTVFAAMLLIVQTEYAWFAAPAASKATRI